MEPLLLLAHRLPYPPNKGDKIRSFHLLHYLSRRYRVYLGAFVDDPADWRHADTVRGYCADSCLLPLHRRGALARSSPALLTGEALTPRFYGDRRMGQWVARILADTGASRVLAFSAAMARFLVPPPIAGVRLVTDFVDVDSDKWAQYGQRKGALGGWVYRREGRRLLAFERRVAAASAAAMFVSRAEADLFSRLAPEVVDRVTWVENGVDTDYFAPAPWLRDPYPPGTAPLVFTGAMDYWPNIDAVDWFARRVFPRIRARWPEARFFVVGARPTEAVRQLQRISGVTVTGGVTDIRPYLAHACLAVAPMRVARGIQNKVLEAMAMGRPVLATAKALEGLELPEAGRLQADSEEALVDEALAVLADGRNRGEHNRAWVQQRYAWDSHLARVADLLDGRSGLRGGPVRDTPHTEEVPHVVGGA
jgi:sugar transferase (PEP-CTERM/EpsH1 system associated)